jgi:hypothetical protein
MKRLIKSILLLLPIYLLISSCKILSGGNDGIGIHNTSIITTVESRKQTELFLQASSSQEGETRIVTPRVESIEDSLIQAINTNGGCKLPCFLGMIFPGKTNSEDIFQLFTPFLKILDSYQYTPYNKLKFSYLYSDVKTETELILKIFLLFPDRIIESVHINALEIDKEGESLEKGIFNYSKETTIMDYYTIEKIITEYGYPDEILYSLYPYTNVWRSTMVVNYLSKGFMIEYLLVGNIVDGFADICLQNTQSVMIWITIPNTKNIQDVLEEGDQGGITQGSISMYKKLSTVLSESETEIYNKLASANHNDRCFRIRISDWVT